MITKIEGFFPDTTPTIYDQEEYTVLRLTSKLNYKVNELIDYINGIGPTPVPPVPPTPITNNSIINVKDHGVKGDGVTDDTVALQNVFNEFKNIYFPDGTYSVSFANNPIANALGLINVRSDTKVTMSNNAVILVSDTALDTTQKAVFCIYGTTVEPVHNVYMQVNISGSAFNDVATADKMPLGIIMRGANASDSDAVNNNIVIDNCRFKNLASCVYIIQALLTTGVGTDRRHTHNVTVRNCFAENIAASFVTADGNGIIISNNTVIGYSINPALAYDAISIHCGYNVVVCDNDFSDFTRGNVINIRNSGEVLDGTKNVIVRNNTIRNCRGIMVVAGNTEVVYGVKNVLIDSNTLEDITSRAIYVNRQVGASVCEDISIVNNKIIETTNDSILIGGTGAETVHHVLIMGNTVKTSAGNGITLVSTSRAICIGNRINMLDIELAEYGLYLLGSTYILTSDNYIWLNDNNKIALHTNNTTDVKILNNFCRGSFTFTGVTYGTILNNTFAVAGKYNGNNVDILFDLSKNKVTTYRSAKPVEGKWLVGDKVVNTAPSAGGYTGWICTVAGTPGTWKGFGLIES